ncbi:hypothetical protein ACUSIJ_16295 [Pseudochelatococcus sp. B33]
MPIALFPELSKALTQTAGRLAAWERLVPLEEQLLRRARGAFLVRWFGPLVPERRLNLYIAIDNIDALRARLEQAQASMPGPAAEMSLLRPLATYSGVLLGSVFSVTGGFIAGYMVLEFLELLGTAWYEEVPKVLIGLIGGPLMGALGPGLSLFLGLPVLVGFAVASAMNADQTTRAVHDLLGDLAAMLDAFFRFWDQLTGPVDEIRNPVLRGLVLLMNRIAHLFAQVLGFVSIVVVKFLPLIPSLVNQWRAIKALGLETIEVAKEAAEGIKDALLAPFRGGSIRGAILGLFTALMALPGKIVDSVNLLIESMKVELGAALDTLNTRISTYIDGLSERIVDAFKATPLGQLIQMITDFMALMPAITSAFSGLGAGTSPSGGGPSKAAQIEESLRSFWTMFGFAVADEIGEALPGERAGEKIGPQTALAIADVIGAARRLSLPDLPDLEVPDLPGVPVLPDVETLRAQIGTPAHRDLGSDAAEMLRAAREAEGARRLPAAMMRRPRSAFADLLRENAAPTAPSPRQLALRDAIYAAVGRVLPAAFRIYAPELRDIFDSIDREIYQVEPTAGPLPEHPQLVLPDSGRLQPVVEVLAIHAPQGAYAPDLRAFRDMVTAAMLAETYRVSDVPTGG